MGLCEAWSDGGWQSLKDGKGGQAHRCAAAADRTGRASLLTLLESALEFVDLISAEDFALELNIKQRCQVPWLHRQVQRGQFRSPLLVIY